MNRSKGTDRVWTGWEGLLLWRELVPEFVEEEGLIDRRINVGGYVTRMRRSGRGRPLGPASPQSAKWRPKP
jgi:hypothetical protein